MRWVECVVGDNPTRGALLSLNELLDADPDNPRRGRDDWLCSSCRRQVALRYGLCGACWLREWKAAQ